MTELADVLSRRKFDAYVTVEGRQTFFRLFFGRWIWFLSYPSFGPAGILRMTSSWSLLSAAGPELSYQAMPIFWCYIPFVASRL
jgi:hypothetical protein